MPCNRTWLATAVSIVLVATAFHAGAADSVATREQQATHLLNRIAYGPRPGDIERVASMGVDAYIDQQLNPSVLPLSPELQKRLDGLETGKASAGEVLAEYIVANRAAKNDDPKAKEQRRILFRQITEETAETRLAQALYSPRQLEEVMVDFWFNHFNVFSGKGLDRALIASYERDAIRPHVFGHFRDLLGATAKHPAMLFYLDNWLSVRDGYSPRQRFDQPTAAKKSSGLNENYARELMELHTLGVDGGYTQKDVTELARMLTGWTFQARDMVRGGATFKFDRERHDSGDKVWLGHTVPAAGQREGEWALDVLARHPATAHHIAFQLSQYFVSDDPPPALVDRVAATFTATDGNIREVLRTLLKSTEFMAAADAPRKFKTPYQFVVSAARASDVPTNNIRPLLGMLNQLGMPLYGCVTPDGYKNTEAAWLNPDAVTRRINFATALASGRLPLEHAPDEAIGMGGENVAEGKKADRPQRTQYPPLTSSQLLATLGPSIGRQTRDTIEQSQPDLRAAMVLGSPDFMRH